MGLNAVIIDPTDRQLAATLQAALLVNDQDPYATQYLSAFRQGKLTDLQP
jgi:hypothetical protein